MHFGHFSYYKAIGKSSDLTTSYTPTCFSSIYICRRAKTCFKKKVKTEKTESKQVLQEWIWQSGVVSLLKYLNHPNALEKEEDLGFLTMPSCASLERTARHFISRLFQLKFILTSKWKNCQLQLLIWQMNYNPLFLIRLC